MSDDPVFDVQQAGDYLGGISRATVYRLMQRGQIKWSQVGGQRRVRRSELDRYLRSVERTHVA